MTRAAFVQAPFHVTWQDVDVPNPGPGQVLIDVAACGVCGTDVHWAAARATTPQPFGHEVAGSVAAVGAGVDGLAPGDVVCLESSAFCGRCDMCRNGRVELCRSAGPVAGGSPSLGFSERMLADAAAVVRVDGAGADAAGALPPEALALAEPLGVAQDLVTTSGLAWDDDVLIVGPGPIGLMAVALARHAGARRVVVSARRTNGARARLAREFGADEVSDAPSAELAARHGRFNRVLVTAPPSTVAGACAAAAYGGTVTFIGLDHGAGATITLDADAFHFNKLQLRASHASPALWLPRSIDLLRRGVVDWRSLITHEFGLDELDQALALLAGSSDEAVKVVVRP